ERPISPCIPQQPLHFAGGQMSRCKMQKATPPHDVAHQKPSFSFHLINDIVIPSVVEGPCVPPTETCPYDFSSVAVRCDSLPPSVDISRDQSLYPDIFTPIVCLPGFSLSVAGLFP